MAVESVVSIGNQSSTPDVMIERGVNNEMVTVSRTSLRKVQTWLKRAQGRYNNHDLKLSIMVINELVDDRSDGA